jgi:hypothetical protein
MKRRNKKLAAVKTAITIAAIILLLTQVSLIVSKLLGFIAVSWWIVFLPVLIVAGLAALTYAVLMIILVIMSGYIEEDMRDVN